jgi:serine phosphatase RsbU (regulator of sigma subunit)
VSALDTQQPPNFELAAACRLEDGGTGHFCLLAPAADGGSFALLADVLGCGPLMDRAASYLRDHCASIAPLESDPARLLEHANEALLDRPPGLRELVSAVCLHYGPGDGGLSWALAGHPSPLVLPSLEPLDPRDRAGLLGLDRRVAPETSAIDLPLGHGLLAFTAETIDAPRDGERLGEAGLAEIVAQHLDLPAPELARRAHDAVVAWSDAVEPQDICLLVLRRGESVAS